VSDAHMVNQGITLFALCLAAFIISLDSDWTGSP
jgi:hypothetical protein